MWLREGHAGRRWGGRTSRQTLALALLVVGLCAVLVACSGSPSGTASATATTAAAGAGGTATTSATTNNTPPAGFPTPTATPNGGGVQTGVDDVCAKTPVVMKQPPSNLPIYPNAQLVQGNTTQNNGQNVGLFDFIQFATDVTNVSHLLFADINITVTSFGPTYADVSAITVGGVLSGTSDFVVSGIHLLLPAVVAIDIAVTSTRGRDRYLRRLKGLPMVTYPDRETARGRFRLMPDQDGVAPAILHEIADRSFARTEDGGWTLKFDRASFFGGDGLDVLETIKQIRIPTLLVRAELSRIMTADSAEHARESNPLVRLVTIPGAHHHVLLDKPEALARVIEDFAADG